MRDALAIDDAACRRCGYALRGLDDAGRCPECGEAVEASVRSDRLRDADPAWLRRIEVGFSCVGVGIVAGFVVPILPGVVATVGTWMATTPDPRRPTEARRLRAAIRGLMVASLVLGAIYLWRTRFSIRPTPSPLFAVAAAITGACELGLLIEYIGRLAARLPDPELAARARPLALAAGGGIGAYALLGIAGPGRLDSQSSVGEALACVAMMIVGILTLVAIVATLNVAVRFAQKLRAEARAARKLDAARAGRDPTG